MAVMAFALVMSVNVKEVYGAGFQDVWRFLTGNKETNQEKFVASQEKKRREVPLIMQKIRWCESRNRQFNKDGTIYRGKINPKDVGQFQINEFYHLESSIKLGMDIYTAYGNEDYAMYLYDTQGTTPWNWSKSNCWGLDVSLEELKKIRP